MKIDVTAGMGALRHRVALPLTLVLMAAWPLTAEKGPELPFELWQAIVSGNPRVIVRCDWAQVAGLSFVERGMEAGRPHDLGKWPMIGAAIRAAAVVTPVLGEIDEAWSLSKDVEPALGDGAWLHTELEYEELRIRLESADWLEIPGFPDLFVEPFDSKDWEYRDFLLKGEKDAEWSFPGGAAVAEVARLKWRIQVGSGGWVYVSPPAGVLRGACCLYAPKLERIEEQGYRFPFDRLPVDGGRFLCRMAVDIPGNELAAEPVPDPESPETEEQRLEEERRRLLASGEATFLTAVGDMLFTASETDGGIAVDLEARTPEGTGGAHTRDILDGGLIALRIVTMAAGPALSDELDSAVFQDLGDRVAGSVVLSQASIHEAADRFLDHRTRIAEINERLRELKELRQEPQP